MPTLDKKDLATFAVAQPDYSVHLREHWQESTRKWVLSIHSPATGQIFTIVTVRGDTRQFTTVETAIDFVREACPNNRNNVITVTYGKPPS